MEIEEAKQIVDACLVGGKNRDETVDLLSVIPVNGNASAIFEYIDLRYTAPSDKDHAITETDSGNSDRLVHLFGNKLRYNYNRNLWLVYTGKHWEWDPGDRISKLAKKTARSIYNEAANEVDDKKRDALAKHAKVSENNQRIRGMIDLAKAELSIKMEGLNANQYLLNVNNGTINLGTGDLQKHNPDDYITFLIPIDYKPEAKSQAWLDFLAKIFDRNVETIKYLQKSMGYSITGNQDEQIFFFNHGVGANGKTTLTGAILDVLGDYGIEIDPQTFTLDKNAKAGPNESLASLYNKRFACATELKSGMTLNVALIKRMSGGEQIKFERKYEHSFNFKPTHKLWLSGNHEPRITDTTNSIWNRLKYIPFNVTIESNERVRGLRQILSSEHKEAILNWLVEGCRLWQSEGLGEPPQVQTAIQSYRNDQDILHDYILENCFLSGNATITQKELFADYKKWAESNDINAIGKLHFRSRLQEKGILPATGNRNVKIWHGVRLKLDTDPMQKDTFVTFVPTLFQSFHEKTSHLESPENNSNKVNTSNIPLPTSPSDSENSEEKIEENVTCEFSLQDCPECGKNEWSVSPEGKYICPCGFTQ